MNSLNLILVRGFNIVWYYLYLVDYSAMFCIVRVSRKTNQVGLAPVLGLDLPENSNILR